MRFSLFAMAAFLAMPSFAFAHVTANPNNGVAGQYFETKFRVSHGCEGSPTTEVHITLPKGTVTAKPQYKSGWNVDIKKSKLDKSVPAGHGKMADEQIDEIIWSGGTLPDSLYDEFGVVLKLPETAGEILWFPVKQVCKEGELNWSEIPAEVQQWHSLKMPAPFVRLTPAPKPGHSH